MNDSEDAMMVHFFGSFPDEEEVTENEREDEQ